MRFWLALHITFLAGSEGVNLTDVRNLKSKPGACFHATNVFANNPFWCLNQKHVSYSRLRKLNQGRVFVPFKHVPVCKEKRKICNQKHVSGSSRKRIFYNKVEYCCFHSFFR